MSRYRGESAPNYPPSAIRYPLPSPTGDPDERFTEVVQAADSGRELRLDSHRACFTRNDPFVVVRRSKEAGDDQLPHIQTGTRRFVLREDFRTREGLRVLVR